MNSGLDEDIASIANVNNLFFYKHFVKESLDSDSDDDPDMLLVVASLLHEDNEAMSGLCGVSIWCATVSLGHCLAPC
jgi:hypothetical protein